MFRFVPALLFVTCVVGVQAQGEGSSKPLSASLAFLIGEWDSLPHPGQGSGYSLFTSEVGGRVIVRKNHAEYPASAGRPASTHDDFMMVYQEGEPAVCRAIYADNEGHIIRYTAEIGADSRVVFVSEAVPNQPRYRLSYATLAGGNLSGKFEIAPPGKPEGFTTYLEWAAKRRGGDRPKN